MKEELSPFQLLDFYLSSGVDQAIATTPVDKKDKPTPLLLKSCSLGYTEKNTVKESDNEMAKEKAFKLLAPDDVNKVDNNSIDLSAINSIEDLRESLLNYNECALKETALNTVFADGNPKASVMVIGEAPGADEDKQGKPFVGMSGQLLDKIMATIGLTRDNFYITNIIPWRPPANRQPTPNETRLCLPFVRKHIQLVDPKILIFVGGTALKALMATTQGIMKVRGRWLNYNCSHDKVRPAFSIYHPAYLLRSPGQKSAVWQDMLVIKQKLVELNILKSNDGL